MNKLNNSIRKKVCSVLMAGLMFGGTVCGAIQNVSAAETSASGTVDNWNQQVYNDCHVSPKSDVHLTGSVTMDSAPAGVFTGTYVIWYARQYGALAQNYSSGKYSFGKWNSSTYMNKTNVEPITTFNPAQLIPDKTVTKDHNYWASNDVKVITVLYY